MTEFTIDDLRLPCGHGFGFYVGHLDEDTNWLMCPGGRIPTQAEINSLVKPDYEAVGRIYDEWLNDPRHHEVEIFDHLNVHRLVDAALGDGT